MEHNYKVGDRVVCIINVYEGSILKGYTLGKIYYISHHGEVFGELVFTDDDGDLRTFFHERFRKATSLDEVLE